MIVLFLFLSLVAGFLFAEVIGYYLHKLLHSEKIPYLSRGHMIHHLKTYGPKMPMRSDSYFSAVKGRASVGKIGLEWIVPAAIVILPTAGLLAALQVPWLYIIVGLGFAIVWAIAGLNYIHDGFHLKDFWMLKHPWFSKWFKEVRRLHDIHHVKINMEGRMHTNYGICFYVMDRLMGTFAPVADKFNEEGFEAAKQRYRFIDDNRSS